MKMCGILAIIVVAVAIGVIVLGNMEKKQQEQDRIENKSGSEDYIPQRFLSHNEIGGTNNDRFYVECVLAECTDFSKEKNVQRAKVFADKYNISCGNDAKAITELFNRCERAHKAISDQINSDLLAKKREAERSEIGKLTKYAELYGKDKRLGMLKAQADELRRDEHKKRETANLAVRLSQEKEKDWAIMGGIADGLAGPGAGAAVALEVQRENAEIRERNQANLQAVMPTYRFFMDNAFKSGRNAKEVEKEIERTKERLIANTPAEEIMKKLSVNNTQVEVTETGAIRIVAQVTAEGKFVIYEDVKAFADGTLLAHVYDGNREVGTAKMVLPVDGVEKTANVVGLCLSGGEKGKKYVVKYTPYKLWLMEK